VRRPPSRAEWAVEAEWRGHSPAEVIQFMSDVADWEDAHPQHRAMPVGVILVGRD
jgi:hypothetical protein